MNDNIIPYVPIAERVQAKKQKKPNPLPTVFHHD